jgi:hypothetical protein
MDQIRLQHDLEQLDEQLATVQRQIAEAWSLPTELETAQALHTTHPESDHRSAKSSAVLSQLLSAGRKTAPAAMDVGCARFDRALPGAAAVA